VGFKGISWGQRKRDERKRATKKAVTRSRDTPTGPPICWVPPCVLPAIPPGRARSSQPTSLWRGEGLVWVDGHDWERAGAMGSEGGGSRRWKMKSLSVRHTSKFGPN